jgi:hypothetical protein
VNLVTFRVPNAITTALNSLPSYAVIVLVLVWIVGRAIPGSVQLFTDWLPDRRRLTQIRNTLDIIQAKDTALEIAKKYGVTGLEVKAAASIADDLRAILAMSGSETQSKKPPAIRPLNIILGSTAAILALLVILGILSGTAKFEWENVLILPLLGAFAAAFVTFFLIIRSVNEFSYQNNKPIGDYIFAALIAVMTSWVGFVLTAAIVQAVFWLTHLGVAFVF